MHIKLYQCSLDIARALDTHFDSDEIKNDTLEAVIGQFEDKAQSVIAYNLNQYAEIEMLDKHIKHMQLKKAGLQAKADKLKDYLFFNMKQSGINEIKSHDGTFIAKIVKNPVSVDVYDESLLDKKFIKQKITESVDKIALKKAIQTGEEINGARLVQNESLRIK